MALAQKEKDCDALVEEYKKKLVKFQKYISDFHKFAVFGFRKDCRKKQ